MFITLKNIAFLSQEFLQSYLLSNFSSFITFPPKNPALAGEILKYSNSTVQMTLGEFSPYNRSIGPVNGTS